VRAAADACVAVLVIALALVPTQVTGAGATDMDAINAELDAYIEEKNKIKRAAAQNDASRTQDAQASHAMEQRTLQDKTGKRKSLVMDRLRKYIDEQVGAHVTDEEILLLRLRFEGHGAETDVRDELLEYFQSQVNAREYNNLSRYRVTGALGKLDRVFVYSRDTDETKEEFDSHVRVCEQQIRSIAEQLKPRVVKLVKVKLDTNTMNKHSESVDGEPKSKKAKEKAESGSLMGLAREFLEIASAAKPDVTKEDLAKVQENVTEQVGALKSQLTSQESKLDQLLDMMRAQRAT